MPVKFPTEFVGRYSQFISDFDGFTEAMSTPPSRTLRVNTLKASREQGLQWLEDLQPRSVPWWDMAFRVGGSGSLGKRLEHFLGLVYVQDAASMVPPLVLAPRPGERVLDIAAAPGSKTTQMAAMMENAGLLVANDFSRTRVRGLIGNVDRAGCLNVAICRMDGVRLGRMSEGFFDRVLVDAPCTCEGTICRSNEALDRWSVSAARRFGKLQKGLLVAGFRALRPGGTLVYSTCTIAPEENEEVVAYLLARCQDAETCEIELEGFSMRDALSEWNGAGFPEGVRRCRRILPQDNDTEAFFLACIRKGEAC